MSTEQPDEVETQPEEDWLPETARAAVRRRPDYQENAQPCEACQ